MSAPDSELRFTSMAITATIVGVVVALFAAEQIWGVGGEAKAETSRFDDAVIIEAALAYKKVEPKSKQPQKRKKKKFRPRRLKISRDQTKEAPPEEEEQEPEKTEKVESDEIDYDSILDKHRKQDEELSDYGSDEELPTLGGQEDGSEHGTAPTSRGHPYEQALDAHIRSHWTLPALERGKGTAIACVRLDESGKIIEKEITQKSQNANIDRSVELALKESTGLDEPVPEELKIKLTEKGACFEFSP